MERMETIHPLKYSKTRNYVDGAVTRLSPYISRGVISTIQVYDYIMTLGKPWQECEKIIQELSWRDYWQNVWLIKGQAIHTDLKNRQESVKHASLPLSIEAACTGIKVVDSHIEKLYQSGYMHNHMRMYVASICCNIAHAHWLIPSKWMYYHLLDGDIASNQLSWQWVAGTFSNKKYYANQDNINRFFYSEQKNTFLDVDYKEFPMAKIPVQLVDIIEWSPISRLPNIQTPKLDETTPTLIYNYYNLDYRWHKNRHFQRVLLLEPSLFKKFPVSDNCMEFMLQLAENIPGIKVFVGEFSELTQLLDIEQLRYKEHPLNTHYRGIEEPRDWMSEVHGYFPSFFLIGSISEMSLVMKKSKLPKKNMPSL